MPAKNCVTCKHLGKGLTEKPCASCFEHAPPYQKWELIGSAKKVHAE